MNSLLYRTGLVFPVGAVVTLVVLLGSTTFDQRARLAAEEEEGLPVAKSDRKSPVNFEKEVLPLFRKNCLACHNATDAEADVVLENPKAIAESGFSDPIIVAGDADKSLLFQVLAHREEPIMPPEDNDVGANNLSPEELALVKLWIDQGAKGDVTGQSQPLKWYPLPEGLTPVYTLSVSEDGRFLAGARANQIFVHEIPTGALVQRLTDPKFLEDGLYNRPGVAHLDQVQSMDFSPDGDLLASGGFRNVKLWRRSPIAAGELPVTKGNATALAITADGKSYALGTAAGKIVLIGSDGSESQTIEADAGPVAGISFAGDGKYLLSRTGRKIALFSTENGKRLLEVEAPTEVHDAVLVGGLSILAVAGAAHQIHQWALEASEGNWKATAGKAAAGHTKPVTSLAAFPVIEGKPSQLLSGSEDGTVRHWELPEAKQVRELKHAETGPAVTDVAVRVDGKRGASVSADGSLRLWNIEDGKSLAVRRGERTTQYVLAMATQRTELSKRMLAAAKKQVEDTTKKVGEETEAGKKAKEELAKAEATLKEKEEAASKAPKDDKKKTEEATKAVDAAKKAVEDAKKKIQDNELNQKRANRLAEEAKKKHTSVETREKAAQEALSTATSSADPLVKPLQRVTFAGSLVAASDGDGSIHVYGSTSGVSVATLPGEGDVLGLSARGSDIAALRKGGALSVTTTRSPWKLERTIGDVNDPSIFVDRVTTVKFSRDGKSLLTGGGEPSRSGNLKLWNVETGELVWSTDNGHSDTIVAGSFSYDGELIATAGTDKFVRLFSAVDGKLIRSMEGHTAHVLGVSWLADGSTVASSGADNVIKVWNVETGEQRRTISGFAKQVTSITYLGIEQMVVSSSGDKTVRQFKTDDGKHQRNYEGNGSFVHCVDSTADGSVIAAGAHDGVIHIWTSAEGKSLHVLQPPKDGGEEKKAD